MTIPVRSSPTRRGLSAHSHTPQARKVYRAARQSCVVPISPAQSPAWATPRLPVMTESPFAPLRCYLLGSRVVHDLDQHYPVLSAPTGSCAEARSSVSLCHRLWSTILAGCCEPLLHLAPSQRYLCRSVLRCLDPYRGGWQGALARFFPCHIGLPPVPLGRLFHRNPFNDFRTGVLSQRQSFDDLQASEFAATQVVPTAGIHSGCWGSRGVYVRAERGSLPPRASDMLAVRMGNWRQRSPTS